MDTVTYIKYLGISFKKCVALICKKAVRIKTEPYFRVLNSSRVNFDDKFMFFLKVLKIEIK